MTILYMIGLSLFAHGVRDHDMIVSIFGLAMNAFGLLYIVKNNKEKKS